MPESKAVTEVTWLAKVPTALEQHERQQVSCLFFALGREARWSAHALARSADSLQSLLPESWYSADLVLVIELYFTSFNTRARSCAICTLCRDKIRSPRAINA